MSVCDLDRLLSEGVRGQRVFVRADLNAPIVDGVVGDDTRLRASLPTLNKLLEGGARVVLASHLGRPKGRRVDSLTLRPVAPRLAELLGAGVSFCEDSVGDSPRAAIEQLDAGQLLLLENLRFHAGEEQNDPDFARALASLVDVYVNDAFGTAHRSHASTVGMVPFVDRAAAGDLLRAELDHLRVVREPIRPLMVILGGAKVSDKLAVLEALAPHADVLAIGGAMAYTFMGAHGEAVGNSLVEPDRFDAALAVERAAHKSGRRLLVPTDHIVADSIDPAARTQVVTQIPDGQIAVDIGPDTAQRYAEEARRAKTIFWNGPMGVFEIDAFASGTKTVATGVAGSAATSVVGGGRFAGRDQPTRARRPDRSPVDRRRRIPGIRPGAPASRRRSSGATTLMRTPIFAANWKMQKTRAEAAEFADGFISRVANAAADIVIAAPFTLLDTLGRKLEGTAIQLAAQNVNPESQGAFTGEISPGMLVDVGCRYAIVGHSERRALYGEGDDFVASKAAALLEHQILPIVCVGETLEQRDAGKALDVVAAQLTGSLAEVPKDRADEIVVAYEPVWAIGTGRTATPDIAQEIHASIRARLVDLFGTAGDRIRIQYGGSVKPETVYDLMSQPDIDGALVGGASLDPEAFSRIVHFERQGE